MKLLVFQHHDYEHPGSLRTYLKEDGIDYDVVEFYKGDLIPDLEPYEALWVMGGAMDVWDVAEHPWLVPEKRAIRHWVRDLERPFLGLCLGHQLLADALGGTCGPAKPAEIGVFSIDLTEEGKANPIFEGMDEAQFHLEWHGVQVAQPPDEASILASSKECAVQAMHIAPYAWSTQFHLEAEPDTFEKWRAVPGNLDFLISKLGEDGVEQAAQDSSKHANEFLRNSRQFYQNFKQACGF